LRNFASTLRTLIAVFALTLGVMSVNSAAFAQEHNTAIEQKQAAPQGQGVKNVAMAEHGEPVAQGADAGHAEAEGAPELPNFISLVLMNSSPEFRHSRLGHFIHSWEKQIFLLIVAAFGMFFLSRAANLRSLVPGKLQTVLELIYEGFHGFIGGILGDHNLKYVPFLATVFLFIFFNNIAGIIPGFASATSVYPTTVALALMVFFYVQFQGIKEAGFGHWMMHFLGSPKDTAGVIIGICLLPLEIIGTLAKPLSLSLRLFGNIMGEDILVGVFLLMGITLAGALSGTAHPIIGVPLHLPFLFLAMLTAVVQALVFTLLSTIYLMLLLPHEHDHSGEVHHHEGEGIYDDSGQHLGGGDISPV
jgi:F-type H+-transporting ATPase subunit a